MNYNHYIASELLYGGLGEDEFRQVKKPIRERNRKNLVAWSVCTGLFCIISLVLSLDADSYAACRTVYFIAIMIDAFTLLGAAFIGKRVPETIYPLIYLFEASLMGTGIGIAICQPDVRTVTMIAVAVIIPSSFIDRTIVPVIMQIIAILTYIIFGKGVIVPDVFSWGLLNLILFSIAGVLIGHVINKSRFERYVYSDSAKKLADMQLNYNAELQKDVEEKTERIVAMQNQFLIGMATMVEKRDNSTGGHIRRTSMGVKLLADAIREDNTLNVSEDFLRMIVKAAPMHDLGKIAVDDYILRKPGRYTEEEFDEMKTHAAEGARIVHGILADLDDTEFCRIAENVAHYHHERVDGSGYPDGLKGNEIPLEARIMAIADVYDALVSKRVYKEKYSFKMADRIILEGMGSHFDPGLRKYYEAARPRLEDYYRNEQTEADRISETDAQFEEEKVQVTQVKAAAV